MKRIVVIFNLLMLAAVDVTAQSNKSGIYITQSDFENKKLSYATDNPLEKNKIHFHEFLNRPYVTVKHNGEKITLFKDDIFAYQKKGRVVRTSDFVSYTFVEKGVIWIYFKDLNIHLGKGVKRVRQYYYSVSGKQKIVPLTVNNLKKSFPDKPIFHQYLDAQFRTDADLSTYDRIQSKLKVNHLLETTIFETGTTAP